MLSVSLYVRMPNAHPMTTQSDHTLPFVQDLGELLGFGSGAVGGLDVAHGTGDALVQVLELWAQFQHDRGQFSPEHRNIGCL